MASSSRLVSKRVPRKPESFTKVFVTQSASPLHRQGKEYRNPPEMVLKPIAASPFAISSTVEKRFLGQSYIDHPPISRIRHISSCLDSSKETISRKRIVTPPETTIAPSTPSKLKTFPHSPTRHLIESPHLRTYYSPTLSTSYDPVKGKGEVTPSPRRESLRIIPKPSSNPITSSTLRYWDKSTTLETPRHVGVRTFSGSGSPIRNPITGETRVIERPKSAFQPRLTVNANLVRRNPITGA